MKHSSIREKAAHPRVFRPPFDDAQKSALSALIASRAHGEKGRYALVGAVGTGKTTLVRRFAQYLLEENISFAALTPDRRSAALLRSFITQDNSVIPPHVKISSLNSFSYEVIQDTYAHSSLSRSVPELITGAEEMSIINEILTDPYSPAGYFAHRTNEKSGKLSFSIVDAVRRFITRAIESGLSPQEIREHQYFSNGPMWKVCTDAYETFLDVLTARDALSGTSAAADRLTHAQLPALAEKFIREGRGVKKWQWLIIDDVQNAPFSLYSLLDAAVDSGIHVLLSGDPDGGVQGFRGGQAGLLSRMVKEGYTPLFLEENHRGGEKITAATRALAENIRVSEGMYRHRAVSAQTKENEEVRALMMASHSDERDWVARQLYLWHVQENIPYSQMAVITRSRSEHEYIARELENHGVNVREVGSSLPLAQRVGVKILLDTISFAIKKENFSEKELLLDQAPPVSTATNSLLVEENAFAQNENSLPPVSNDDIEKENILKNILFSPYFSATPVDYVRLRRLVTQAGQYFSTRAPHSYPLTWSKTPILSWLRWSKEISALLSPQDTRLEPAKIIDKLRKILVTIHRSKNTAHDVQTVLWQAWESFGVAEDWQNKALEDSRQSHFYHELLDDVIQLFRTAQRLDEREENAQITDFITALQEQELPEDSVARTALSRDAITLTTPAGAQGLEWKCVIVMGVNEGLWPNLSDRDRYVRATRLLDIAMSKRPAGAPLADPRTWAQLAEDETFDDELSQLYFAIGRAKEKVVITCVNAEDTSPSRFFDAAGDALSLVGPIYVPPATDVRGLIASARKTLWEDSPEEQTAKDKAPKILQAIYSAAQHDREYLRLLMPEDDTFPDEREALIAPTWEEKTRRKNIRISPSGIERIIGCPLSAIAQESLGQMDEETRVASTAGTIIHTIAADTSFLELPDAKARLSARVQAFEKGWASAFPDGQGWVEREKSAYLDMVRALHEYLEHAEKYPTEREKRMSLVLPSLYRGGDTIEIRAALDRVEKRTSGVEIVDFKTGKHIAPDQEENFQLLTYQALMSHQLGERTSGAELRDLRTITKKFDPRDKISPIGLPKARMQSGMDETKWEIFLSAIAFVEYSYRVRNLPALGNENMCTYCPIKTSCPAHTEGELFS